MVFLRFVPFVCHQILLFHVRICVAHIFVCSFSLSLSRSLSPFYSCAHSLFLVLFSGAFWLCLIFTLFLRLFVVFAKRQHYIMAVNSNADKYIKNMRKTPKAKMQKHTKTLWDNFLCTFSSFDLAFITNLMQLQQHFFIHFFPSSVSPSFFFLISVFLGFRCCSHRFGGQSKLWFSCADWKFSHCILKGKTKHGLIWSANYFSLLFQHFQNMANFLCDSVYIYDCMYNSQYM